MIQHSSETKKVSETKKRLLLLDDPNNQKALDVLNLIQPSNSLNEQYKETVLESKREEFNDTLTNTYQEKSVFSLQEIYNDCVKFDLELVRSSTYKGELSLDFVKSLNDFCTENKIVVGADDYKRFVYFLVPKRFSTFGREHRYKATPLNASSLNDEYINIPNPVAFYKVNDDFILINPDNKNYKNIWNYFKGLINYSQFSTAIFRATFLVTLSILAGSLLFFDASILNWYSLLFYGFSIVIGSASTITDNNGEYNNDGKYNKHYYSKYLKNKRYSHYLLIGLFVLLPFTLSNIVINIKLHKYGNLYTVTDNERVFHEKEALESGISYDYLRTYIETYKKTTTYSPGFIFPNRKTEISHRSYTSKEK